MKSILKTLLIIFVLGIISIRFYNWYKYDDFSFTPKPSIPKCDSKEINKLISNNVTIGAKILKEDLVFIDLKNIKEVGFNSDKEIRSCESLLITTQGNEDFNFFIKWKNKKEGTFEIKPTIDKESQEELKEIFKDAINDLSDKDKVEIEKQLKQVVK
jgi:hypothetical protein